MSVKSWEKLGQVRSPRPEELGLLNILRFEKWVFIRIALVQGMEPYDSWYGHTTFVLFQNNANDSRHPRPVSEMLECSQCSRIQPLMSSGCLYNALSFQMGFFNLSQKKNLHLVSGSTRTQLLLPLAVLPQLCKSTDDLLDGLGVLGTSPSALAASRNS